MKQSKFPPGWDEERIRRLLEHDEEQTENEAVAEDEGMWEDPEQTTVELLRELLSRVRELIAEHARS